MSLAKQAAGRVGGPFDEALRTAPYSLRIRMVKNNISFQLCIAGPQSPLWRHHPPETMQPMQNKLPYTFLSSADPKSLDIPRTLLHSERHAPDFQREVGGRPVLYTSTRTVGFHGSRSKRPEAHREAAVRFLRQYSDLVHRAKRNQEMPIIARRPSPHGQSNRTSSSWQPDLRPTRPFVPPIPSALEVVLVGWRTTALPTVMQTLDAPNGYEFRKLVTHVRDETGIITRGVRPKARPSK